MNHGVCILLFSDEDGVETSISLDSKLPDDFRKSLVDNNSS